MARIVVADDDADIRELVEFKLSSEGHEVIGVGDGAAAVEACRTHRPDLALLDVMMPVATGIEAVRVIRADPDPRLAALPVVLLTARAQEIDVEVGLSAGADAYITKPFSPRELAQRVAEMLADGLGRPRAE